MRHASRCVFWRASNNPADHENSLLDAYISLPPGKMLVYRIGLPAGSKAPEVNKYAVKVSARLGGALVQWPESGASMTERQWLYAIQKPGKAA